uniref:Mediator of RNA polymerase II transcription subunit 22 n=2 Tax=Plectus sambesii TaxID=2011161 RepID=A0A914VV32_9BILA
MNSALGAAGSSGAAKKGDKAVLTKNLILKEYKQRLRDSVKSLNDNFQKIAAAGKVPADDNHKTNWSRMSEYYTANNEVNVRAALMVRAVDELLKLNADLKQFLILHDFTFVTNAIESAEASTNKRRAEADQRSSTFRSEIASESADIEKELTEGGFAPGAPY